MADIVWPSTLPQAGILEDMSGGPQTNVVSFQPEQGPSIDRRAASSVVRKRKIKLPPIDNFLTYQRFVTFFETTLNGGVLPFIWYDPFYSRNVWVKFVQNDPVYNEVMINSGMVQVDFELFIMRPA